MLVLALGAVSLPAYVEAAGLGRLDVQSSLGRPLRAEIDLLLASPEELQSLSARLASQSAFKQAGVEFTAALTDLRFVIDRRDGRPVVRITSSRPIEEPFLDFLIELNWATGRLVREYTVLLDPAELRVEPTSVPSVPPSVAVPSAPSSAVSSPPSGESSSTPAVNNKEAKAPSKEAPSTTEGEVKVRRGDTLGKVASRHLAPGVTLDQMLVALYRANPQAFIGDNMNRLKAGAVLRVPAVSEATALSSAEARKQVASQASGFSAYRSKLADSVKQAPPVASTSAEPKSAVGQVTPKVEEKTVAQAVPQVIVKPVLADKKEAEKKALEETEKRNQEREKNIAELKQVLDKQKQLTGSSAAPQPQGAPVQAPSVATTPIPVAPPASTAPATPTQATGSPATSNQSEVIAPAVVTPSPAPDVAPAAPPKPVVTAPPSQPLATTTPVATSFLSGLLANRLLIGGMVAGIIILLGVVGGAIWYRRRKAQKFTDFQDSILTGGDLQSNSVFGATGGQSINTSDSTFNSNFSASASQIDSNEVDPIAEADVYIAYGRDAQAEEILKEALKNAPERQAIRTKLLEIFAHRKDLAAFAKVAGEIYHMTRGQGEDWLRAVELGRSIDPQNPLYNQQAAPPVVGAPVTPTVVSSGEQVAVEPVQVDFDINLPQNTQPTEPHFEVPVGTSTVPLTSSTLPPSVSSDTYNLDSRLSLNQNTVVELTQTSRSFDFNLDAPDEASTGSSSVVEEHSSTPPGHASPAVEPTFGNEDFGLASTPSPTPTSVPEFDLSGISLDLEPSKNDAPSAGNAVMDAATSPKQQEMATKLDLAMAYQEIGDREGAKELLEEVLRGGDAEQQARAQKMIESIR